MTSPLSAGSLDGPLGTLTILALALIVDRALGEPPARIHPVVWIGATASRLLRFAPRSGAARQLLFGGAIALAVPLLSGWVVWLLFSCAFPAAIAAVGGPSATSLGGGALALLDLAARAWVLKSLFAVSALGDAARAVRDALVRDDLREAREDLACLCSRDPAELGAEALAAAAIESVAENASDSIVAPLLCFLVLGLPATACYRAINTLDAMIGYRGRFEHLGKAAARLDDLANLIPARATALLLLAGGALAGADARSGWRVLRRDAGRTASPNAGRPMAAMAGLLGVALEKTGHYRLGDPRERLGPEKIDAAWRIVQLAIAAGLSLAAAVLGAPALVR